MAETRIILNVAAIVVAGMGCYVAHIAGIKYAYLHQVRRPFHSAIISSVAASALILGAIALVQLS
jgi:hypothetical protein